MHFSADRLAVRRRNGGSPTGCFVSHNHCLEFQFFTCYIAESKKREGPAQYVLSLEQMIENDYPVPSYMADVFQKPPGWVETPEPLQLTGEQKRSAPKQRIYAVDCEMVRWGSQQLSCYVLTSKPVHY